MDSSVDSLSNSFRRVPAAAVPAMLDCIIDLTTSSPSLLFSSLLDDFPKLTKEIDWSQKLDLENSNRVGSYVGALCHLLKKPGANLAALQSFIWEILIPLIESGYDNDRGMVKEVIGSFFDLVTGTSSWGIVETSLVPYLLRFLGLSMGMPESEEWAVYKWAAQLVEDYDDQLADLDTSKGSIPSKFAPFPLPLSCHLLTSMLDSGLQCKDARIFAANLLWDLCIMTPRMLLYSLEHRSCAISSLLPFIFKAFALKSAFQILICAQTHTLSRKQFFLNIWNCCKTLFSQGYLERRDAYTILSLHLSFLSFTEAFDLRAEKEFWDEIKKGLVDKEGLVRKLALHILKVTVLTGEESQHHSGGTENIASGSSLNPQNMSKKGRWADKEAKSLGVGKISNWAYFGSDSQQKWGAFFLLYEMLEDYGTHLVEAAWNHQITLLLQISTPCINSLNGITGGSLPDQMVTFEEKFNWVAVLWERGFCHDNPQVRCLIMESFLGIEWKNYGDSTKLVLEDFVFGPFIQGLNDPVHHKEFGLKGIYSSRTIEGAAIFLRQYTSYLNLRKKIDFLSKLASLAKKHSFGRAGLMSLAKCIASAAYEGQICNNHEVEQCGIVQVESAVKSCPYNNKEELLDALRFVIENSRQHFNPNYRLKVCEKILDAATSSVAVCDVSLELLLNFISTLPQDTTDFGGPLRSKVQKWLWGCDDKHYTDSSQSTDFRILKSLDDFPANFINHNSHLEDDFISYDDEDLEKWDFEAKRWARVRFLVIKDEHHLDPTLMFIRDHGVDLGKQNNHLAWVPVKLLILILTVVHELQSMKNRTANRGFKGRTEPELALFETVDDPNPKEVSILVGKFVKSLTLMLDGLISFAQSSCPIFWSHMAIEDEDLPCSVRGKLGGPSQRWLSVSTTTVVLQAITSVKSLASVSLWCAQFGSNVNYALTFLWQLSWKIIQSPTCSSSETEAEICIGAFEALAYILKAISSLSSPLDFVLEKITSSSLKAEGEPLLDSLLHTFLQSINNLIAVGQLVRSRRAVLMNWKWVCLESLLSIPETAFQNGVYLHNSNSVLSDATVRLIFGDLVDSLENAGEGSFLPMLRSVRLVLRLFALGQMGPVVSSSDGVDTQMMWQLVHSSWILHISCNKRRVAPTAALLSSVLHYSVFNYVHMHEVDNEPGPFKWLVEKILKEGTRSPRTIRLAALHLTGLWLVNPNTIKYYMKELKLLTSYGSVAFDEDFKGELVDNPDARSEVSVLSKSPDPELTEEFINTELYARVSVAVLFYKLADLADMVGLENENEKSRAALEAGKMFLLELLDYAEHDTDLGKELYKKYSAIHRRKVRVWQMICILSRFVDQDIVHKVTSTLQIALYRNNMPGVRQYMETFAIYIYLKFPFLVSKQLGQLLRDYDMRSQALSSYVFIAANVILHSSEEIQYRNLNELLPPIIPLLTSHHHTLRGFTQLLVHQVLSKLFPAVDNSATSLEQKCFVELKLFLEGNSDCSKLRASMEGYLSDFNPNYSISPHGIFKNRVEEREFECVPTSLMERVVDFLNNVREDLRFSMAKDAAALKNVHFHVNEDPNYEKTSENVNKEKLSLDFQKKVTFPKHKNRDASCALFLEMEKEDRLLDQVLHSRDLAVEKSNAGRQNIILVASLLDRIPNLAGLARTCEIFKAGALAIADTTVLNDKQFQLISVTAEKWVPIIEVPTSSVNFFLEKKKQEGYSILGLEQTANSIPLDGYVFPKKSVLVLGREKEGVPVELIHILDACIEIPQLGIVRSLNVHVSGAIALWEYTRQQRSQ